MQCKSELMRDGITHYCMRHDGHPGRCEMSSGEVFGDHTRTSDELLDFLEALIAPSLSQFGNNEWQLWNNGKRFHGHLVREVLNKAMDHDARGRALGAGKDRG